MVLNFSPKPIEYTLWSGFPTAKLVLCNIAGTSADGSSTSKLEPWDALVYTF